MAGYTVVAQEGTEEEYDGPTGHEQTGIALVNWLLLLASIAYFGVAYRKQHDEVCFEHWSWYVTNGIQTFFCVALSMLGAYPGYAVFKYTAGLGNDGPGSRFESFYINMTMGMVLGVPAMAMVDHFVFFFSWFIMLFCWMPWPQVQVATSGLSCLCGLYMALWIPTNIASGNAKDPAPFVICGIFTACSFTRVLSTAIGFHGHCRTILLVFNCVLFALVTLMAINGVCRAERAKHSIALTKNICDELGDGPVWAVWPEGKAFPSGWWFEPPPCGSEAGWPYERWPSGPSSANPPAELIEAAAEEMQEEMPLFYPLWLVLGVLFALVFGFLLAIALLGESTC